MSNPNTEKWKTVKIPKGLSQSVDEFVNSQKAFRLGLMSNSQVVAYAVREFLKEESVDVEQIREKIEKTIAKIDRIDSSEHKPIE
tara:strand:- start:167 stop:421 length:255 start_codon:yes stop_codon:yes gene_type:complete